MIVAVLLVIVLAVAPEPVAEGFEPAVTVERDIGVDFHDGVLVHQHLLGKSGEIDALSNRLTVEEQPLRLAGRHLDRGVVAEIGTACHAVVASAAEHRSTGNDFVARPAWQ